MIAVSTPVQIIPPTRFMRHLSTGTSRIDDKRSAGRRIARHLRDGVDESALCTEEQRAR